jgi:hypothetical protein
MQLAKEVWTAVQKESAYPPQHNHLFEKFNELRDAIKSTDDPRLQDHRCLVNHVAPIYNHTASQGYQPLIHYRPLADAVSAWCLKKPVKHWDAPPDQWSPSASPAIPPRPITPPQPPKPTTPPRPKPRIVSRPAPASSSTVPNPAPTKTPTPKPAPTKPEKGKAKAKTHISPEFVDSDSDVAKARPTPTEKWNPLCDRCKVLKQPCHIYPGRTKDNSACFECNFRKVHCPQIKDAVSGGVEDVMDVVKDVPEAPKKKARKRPTAVPRGEPGQLAGAFLHSLFFFF